MRLLRGTLCGSIAVAVISGCSGAQAGPHSGDIAASTPVSVQTVRQIIQDAHTTQRSVTITAHMDGRDPLDQRCRVRFVLPKAADCVLTRRDERIAVIALEDALYVSVTGPGGGAAPSWRRLDPRNVDLSEFDGVLAQIVGGQAGIADDVVLTRGVSTVVRTTPDRVDGRRATRYDIAIDLTALYRSMAGQAVDPRMRHTFDEVAAAGGRAEGRIWIDQDNLPIRQSIRGPTGTETIRYAGWGVPVDITPPPLNHVR